MSTRRARKHHPVWYLVAAVIVYGYVAWLVWPLFF